MLNPLKPPFLRDGGIFRKVALLQDFHRWHLRADVLRTCASGIAQGAWRAPWHLRADKWWPCHART